MDCMDRPDDPPCRRSWPSTRPRTLQPDGPLEPHPLNLAIAAGRPPSRVGEPRHQRRFAGLAPDFLAVRQSGWIVSHDQREPINPPRRLALRAGGVRLLAKGLHPLALLRPRAGPVSRRPCSPRCERHNSGRPGRRRRRPVRTGRRGAPPGYERWRTCPVGGGRPLSTSRSRFAACVSGCRATSPIGPTTPENSRSPRACTCTCAVRRRGHTRRRPRAHPRRSAPGRFARPRRGCGGGRVAARRLDIGPGVRGAAGHHPVERGLDPGVAQDGRRPVPIRVGHAHSGLGPPDIGTRLVTLRQALGQCRVSGLHGSDRLGHVCLRRLELLGRLFPVLLRCGLASHQPRDAFVLHFPPDGTGLGPGPTRLGQAKVGLGPGHIGCRNSDAPRVSGRSWPRPGRPLPPSDGGLRPLPAPTAPPGAGPSGRGRRCRNDRPGRNPRSWSPEPFARTPRSARAARSCDRAFPAADARRSPGSRSCLASGKPRPRLCLAKSPADRFQDAESLDQALAECACSDEWDQPLAAQWWLEAGQAATTTASGTNVR